MCPALPFVLFLKCYLGQALSSLLPLIIRENESKSSPPAGPIHPATTRSRQQERSQARPFSPCDEISQVVWVLHTHPSVLADPFRCQGKYSWNRKRRAAVASGVFRRPHLKGVSLSASLPFSGFLGVGFVHNSAFWWLLRKCVTELSQGWQTYVWPAGMAESRKCLCVVVSVRDTLPNFASLSLRPEY